MLLIELAEMMCNTQVVLQLYNINDDKGITSSLRHLFPPKAQSTFDDGAGMPYLHKEILALQPFPHARTIPTNVFRYSSQVTFGLMYRYIPAASALFAHAILMPRYHAIREVESATDRNHETPPMRSYFVFAVFLEIAVHRCSRIYSPLSFHYHRQNRKHAFEVSNERNGGGENRKVVWIGRSIEEQRIVTKGR